MSTLVHPIPQPGVAEPPLSSHESRRAALYDLVQPWALDLSSFVPLLVDELKTRVRPVMIEFGCGTGNLALQVAQALPALAYYGFDDSAAMLQRFSAKARALPPTAQMHLKGPVDLYRKVSANIITQAPKADIVLMSRFLQTIPLMVDSADYYSRADMIRLARQMLRPGGKVMIVEDVYGASAEEHRSAQDTWDSTIGEALDRRMESLKESLPPVSPEMADMAGRGDRVGLIKAVRAALDRGQERQPLPWPSWHFLVSQLGLKQRPFRHAVLPSVWLMSID